MKTRQKGGQHLSFVCLFSREEEKEEENAYQGELVEDFFCEKEVFHELMRELAPELSQVLLRVQLLLDEWLAALFVKYFVRKLLSRVIHFPLRRVLGNMHRVAHPL